MNTLIIHNSQTYGGAGLPWAGAATCSTNEAAPKICVHELGHSLFGLGDEYTYGDATDQTDPNCDVAGCPKWRDLQGHFGVGCKPSKCKGGSYYAGSDSMMGSFDYQFGAVNERIMCCKYVYHLKQTPPFCQKFNQNGLDLQRYCRTDVWKGRYTKLRVNSLLMETAEIGNGQEEEEYLKEMADDPQGDAYVYVQHPIMWTISRQASGEWVCDQGSEELEPGLYLKESVLGDAASDLGSSSAWRKGLGRRGINIEVSSGSSADVARTVFFATDSPVEVPPDMNDQQGQQHISHNFFDERSTITLILNEGESCHVQSI